MIAKYLNVPVERITDQARFAEDFGADWLDCLEIIMMIEDQVPGLEITDHHIDQMGSVGELIRLVESVRAARERPPLAS